MSDEPLLEEITACEHRVWRALVAGDPEADLAALDDAFLGVYPDGFAGKSDHAAQLSAGPSVQRYKLSDVHLLTLGADHVLLCYRARYMRAGRSADEEMLVSSIWRRAGDRWLNVFSQDTPATGHHVP